ncbi:MAG: LTA synthase family protein [Lachnospiraceae bacterium]
MRHLWKCLSRLLLISLCINFMIELCSRKSLVSLSRYLVFSPAVFCLNTVLILCPFLIVLFTRRKVFAATLLSVVWLVMGVVNGVLLIFRTTPFTASDFRLVKYALSMLTSYLEWWHIVLAGVMIAITILLCIWVWKKSKRDEYPVEYRTSGTVSLVVLAGIWGLLKVSILTGAVAIQFGNIGQAFQDYGFAYCFSNSLFNTGIPKPEDYSSEVVEEIESEIRETEPVSSPEEQRMPNVIMVQLESFMDPMQWEHNPVTEDPIPYYRSLMETYPSGYLSVPSVGAGTANTEFECITGMNLDFFGPGEYPYKTVLQKTVCESLAFNLKSLGYKTHAIHNNEGTFYDRHKVFSQLGFDTFTPMEYMYHIERNPIGWPKDKVLVEEVEKTLDSSLGADFIYTISVQGHGKYPSFEYYCKQIHEMDLFVKDLVQMLDERKEPTVVVFYGDHLPGFSWTAEEMKNQSLFQTEYVVWNNLGLKPVIRDVESYQIGAHILDMLDIHEGTMVRFHQQYLKDKNPDEELYLEAMEILEYDILYGERTVYGGESPYQATRMEMGITPIIQRTTVHIGDQIIVFGENFNDYSQICVNGKAVDTPYKHERRLIATGITYKDGEVITVEQIGKDKISLGKARKGCSK